MQNMYPILIAGIGINDGDHKVYNNEQELKDQGWDPVEIFGALNRPITKLDEFIILKDDFKDNDAREARINSLRAEYEKLFGAVLHEFKETHNTIENIISPKFLKMFYMLPHSEQVARIEEALLRKLETDPDYELWVPLKYWRNEAWHSGREEKKELFFFTNNVWVSSKGNLWFLRKDTGISKGFKSTNDYLVSGFRVHGTKHSFMVHRAVACNFVTPKGKYKEMSLSKLETDHKDTVKTHNDFTNLQWVDSQENSELAVKAGLRTYETGINHHTAVPLLGVYIRDDKYKGTTFIVTGGLEVTRYNLTGAYKVVSGDLKQSKGCTFTIATKEDINTYPSITKTPKDFQSHIKALDTNYKDLIVGYNVDTKEYAEFNGTQSMRDKGLNSAPLYNTLAGDKPGYMGWVFVREPNTQDRETTKEQLGLLADNYRSIARQPIRVFQSTNVDTGEVLTYKGEAELKAAGKDVKRVKDVLRKGIKVAKGLSWKELESIPQY